MEQGTEGTPLVLTSVSPSFVPAVGGRCPSKDKDIVFAACPCARVFVSCARNPEVGVGEPPTRVHARTHLTHNRSRRILCLEAVDLEPRHRICLIPPRIVHSRRVVHSELSKAIARTIAIVHRQSYQALHLSRSAPLGSTRL